VSPAPDQQRTTPQVRRAAQHPGNVGLRAGPWPAITLFSNPR
jgi:hypothetical protein